MRGYVKEIFAVIDFTFSRREPQQEPPPQKRQDVKIAYFNITHSQQPEMKTSHLLYFY